MEKKPEKLEKILDNKLFGGIMALTPFMGMYLGIEICNYYSLESSLLGKVASIYFAPHILGSSIFYTGVKLQNLLTKE